MKFLFTFFGVLLLMNAIGQINNPEFDHWEVIQLGQPYEDPTGWYTNNGYIEGGLATTPVTKGVDSSDYYAIIQSNLNGIDALLSGELGQTISTENLIQIKFQSKCDSLFQSGRCIVQITGRDLGEILFVDSISTTADSFAQTIINIESEWVYENDSISIQFIAKGNIDAWDEKEDGYSVFLIDKVTADYITRTEVFSDNSQIDIYPNPTDGVLNFTHNLTKNPSKIEITTLLGQSIFRGDYSGSLHLDGIPGGVYIITLVTNTGTYSEKIIVNTVN